MSAKLILSTSKFSNIQKPILLFAFLFILLSAEAQFVHREGTKIIDPNGEELIFRGIGLGGWMLQEGYMLRTSGPQHEIEAKIEALIGETRTQEFYEAWLANHMRKVDVDSMASWGYNSIRLPMHYKLFTPPIEEEPVAGEITWLDKGFDMTDQLLDWCKDNNIYLILDLHAAPGGQGENADISDYDSSKPSLWESEANQDKMVALWRKLAERYVNEPMLGAYDIINEPNWGFQNHEQDLNGCAESANTPLWDLQKRVTDAIREVDQNHLIFIEGNCWGNNYNGLPTLWDDNLAISFHKYWNPNTQNAIQGMLDMRSSRNVPIWLGETGENANTWFTNAVSLFESNGFGWSWWPLKKLGNNNPLQIPMNDGYQQVVDYWNGNGNKPSADEAYAALMQLTEDLKLENNIYHPDVVDAKIRQPHTDETKPFKNHTLVVDETNIVAATDFDLGKVGFAYQDEEFTNTTGNAGGQAWNLGYNYRNDGVDIEISEDESENSNGYNVGWTEAGEWIQYTLNIDSSGAYKIGIRYAGQSEGIIRYEVDGVDLAGQVTLTPTGGFQSWEDKFVEDIILESGTHTFRVYIDKGGANIGFFSFFLSKQIIEVPFQIVSAHTTGDQELAVVLNKSIDESTLSEAGFNIMVDENAYSIEEVAPEDPKILSLKVTETFTDRDEITLHYAGDISNTDGQILEEVSDLMVRNTLPVHVQLPALIEAEDFDFNNGLELENTTDIGGGQNIGYTDAGDYLDYNIYIEQDGWYQFDVRVAAENNTGVIRFQQFNKSEELLNEVAVDIPITGGWQTWETVTAKMILNPGNSTLRLYVADAGFNVNWFRVSFLGVISGVVENKLSVFPNPARDFITIQIPGVAEGQIRIIGLDGKTQFDKKVSFHDPINIGDLPKGLYILEVESGSIFRNKLVVD